MDPVTHALAGATVAWAVSGGQLGRKSLLLGAAAAVLPDADVLIRSAADPLLAIEHHRGFTHSLLFIPFGALIATLPFLRRIADSNLRAYLAALSAYATHPALDAATTYGTQLFWPFSSSRVGLDIISIIDPLFTLILAFALVAAYKTRRSLVIGALAIALIWLAAGAVQRERATEAQRRVATSRGDDVIRGEVFPTLGNTILWRSVYRTGNTLRIDRIRVPWFRAPSFSATASVSVALMDGSASAVSEPSREEHRRDFRRFAWFSDGWIARDPADATVIADARYSLRADTWSPVWGIRFTTDPTRPTEWVNRTRERARNPRSLFDDITGTRLHFRPVP